MLIPEKVSPERGSFSANGAPKCYLLFPRTSLICMAGRAPASLKLLWAYESAYASEVIIQVGQAD